MRPYFAYIRVSTVKQGEHGSSLQEQRDAITTFAARNGIEITAWFEERETAASVGRHEFSRMLAALKKGKASGVIFHKIDRSARNLKDWSAVQDLADEGIDVRFTQESINLGSNEGKLTGDFLAVISSHYIRNLREEVKKGIQGRLKQGLYPLGAPLGYLDQGGGKAKTPDPIRAAFVRDAFELYVKGCALRALSDELYRRGLRSKSGKRVHINALSEMLHNPFYMGIIRMKRSGKHYAGVHQPLISKNLFEQVQAKLEGKANAQVFKHDFLFRRLITCSDCKYRLIGERQKTYTYYRCHTSICPTCSVREECADNAVRASFQPLLLADDTHDELREMNASLEEEWADRQSEYERSISLQLENVNSRLSRLMDAYLDGFDRDLFEEKKLSLLMERQALTERLVAIRGGGGQVALDIDEYLEQLRTLSLSYENAFPFEKREMIKSATSNLFAAGKNVVVKLQPVFQAIADANLVPTGGPARYEPRNPAKKIFNVLLSHCAAQDKKHQQHRMYPEVDICAGE
jgi:DNA invertase Pin-like site-specific DNA recombinase